MARSSARGISRRPPASRISSTRRQLGAKFLDPDSFYFDKAAETIKKERGKEPLFLFVYTAQNHFPWSFRFRPDLAPEWRDLGNRPDVDEYLRRQHLSAVDYQAFVARLKREFPDESFLIVRFGDHQPYFARNMIDPGQDDSMIARHIAAADPRFLTTYYAINTLNFTPRDMSSAVDALDAPYLPLVVLEAAGVPLDASFAEQKRILQRCQGPVLSLQRRRRGPPLQPAADRCRIDQGAVGSRTLQCAAHRLHLVRSPLVCRTSRLEKPVKGRGDAWPQLRAPRRPRMRRCR